MKIWMTSMWSKNQIDPRNNSAWPIKQDYFENLLNYTEYI